MQINTFGITFPKIESLLPSHFQGTFATIPNCNLQKSPVAFTKTHLQTVCLHTRRQNNFAAFHGKRTVFCWTGVVRRTKPHRQAYFVVQFVGTVPAYKQGVILVFGPQLNCTKFCCVCGCESGFCVGWESFELEKIVWLQNFYQFGLSWLFWCFWTCLLDWVARVDLCLGSWWPVQENVYLIWKPRS